MLTRSLSDKICYSEILNLWSAVAGAARHGFGSQCIKMTIGSYLKNNPKRRRRLRLPAHSIGGFLIPFP